MSTRLWVTAFKKFCFYGNIYTGFPKLAHSGKPWVSTPNNETNTETNKNSTKSRQKEKLGLNQPTPSGHLNSIMVRQ